MKSFDYRAKIATVIAAAFAAAAPLTPASAEVLQFAGALDGSQEVPDPVITDAFGDGLLLVDTVAQSVSFSLNVVGIDLDALNDGLIANADLGPVHLHNAAFGINGPIIVPFAFDSAAYQDTADGFSLTITDFSFADAVAQSGSMLTFNDFVNELIAGNFYINVHTDLFGGGEIRGQLSQVPAPGAIGLFLIGAGALRLFRRR